MALELYMIGLIVRDMKASVDFYRHLGVDIPAGSEAQPFVGIKMGELTFFLNSQPVWDPQYGERAETPMTAKGSYGQVLEFKLPEHGDVDAMYARLTQLGYRGYRAPYRPPIDAYFALVYDPDGNMVLLSA